MFIWTAAEPHLDSLKQAQWVELIGASESWTSLNQDIVDILDSVEHRRVHRTTDEQKEIPDTYDEDEDADDDASSVRTAIPIAANPRLGTGESGGLYTPPPPLLTPAIRETNTLEIPDIELQVPPPPPPRRSGTSAGIKWRKYTPYTQDWTEIMEFRKRRMEREAQEEARLEEERRKTPVAPLGAPRGPKGNAKASREAAPKVTPKPREVQAKTARAKNTPQPAQHTTQHAPQPTQNTIQHPAPPAGDTAAARAESQQKVEGGRPSPAKRMWQARLSGVQNWKELDENPASKRLLEHKKAMRDRINKNFGPNSPYKIRFTVLDPNFPKERRLLMEVTVHKSGPRKLAQLEEAVSKDHRHLTAD
ncbi:hypothetical protein BDZ91DRAFT_803252 [Kalaharituber pfeilii]|nr:hypothetical protein BDZ91DRAFT_803252 [Kalaharituber pfeilii]